MAKAFNWGIIGLGKIAGKFAEDLQAIPGAKLYAVASRSIKNANEFGERFNVPHRYGAYAEIFKNKNIDAVYIATPHVYHCENTIMCLEHQVPVLCEKPFAMNSEQVRRMVSLARFQKTFLMEALWTRFLPTTLQVLKWIKANKIGKINGLKADFGFQAAYDPKSRLFNPDLGGGSLLDVGIYPVFLSLLVLGKPRQIKAMASLSKSGIDEACAMILKYDKNKMAILDSSIVSDTETTATIFGEKGNIKINSRWHEPTSLTLTMKGKKPKDFFFDFQSRGYHYEALEVMNCLKKGKIESDLLPHDFSLDLMEMLDEIRMEAGIYYPKYDNMTKVVKSDEGIRFSKN